MDFSKRYEVLEPLPAREIRSYHGREIATGREVVLHLVSADNKLVLSKLASLIPEKRSQVIEQIPDGGSFWVITQSLPGGLLFEDWIDSPGAEPLFGQEFKKGKWQIPVAPPAPASASGLFGIPQEPNGGEFTRMFHAPIKSGVVTNQPQPVTPPPGPGDFTRMFQTPAATGEPPGFTAPPPVVERPKEEPRAQPSREPGAFTRLFQTPSAAGSGPPESPPPGGGPSGPGDFTRMFQSPTAYRDSGASPTPPPNSGPDDFTRMLQTPPPASQRFSPASEEPGSFTRVFGTPASKPAPPAPQVGPLKGGATQVFSSPTPAPSAPAEPKSPGEYTRIFGAPTTPAPPRVEVVTAPPPQMTPSFGVALPQVQPSLPYVQVPQVPQPPALPGVAVNVPQPVFTPPVTVSAPAVETTQGPRPATNLLPLVLILCSMLVVAILLMIYFATRH